MIKLATIIGARPQFIKSAMLSRMIEKQFSNSTKSSILREIIIHTGQHYDHNMSRVFFEELGIPDPDYHLEVGSGDHGQTTGKMLCEIEAVLKLEQPDIALVYGDTNSTLAGALAAAKLHIPVAHVEAGLRSFNRSMPEEINRRVTDHISDWLFAPTIAAIANLKKEGILERIVHVGDIMLDAFMFHQHRASTISTILDVLNLEKKKYFLCTVHRQENTDDPSKLASIFNAFDLLGRDGYSLVLPLHPRTRKNLHYHNIQPSSLSGVRIIEPVGYLDMISLETNAALIFTDSGGIQKEAYFANVPCITLRDETEWVETVEAGVNFLAGAGTSSILGAYNLAMGVDVKLQEGLFGDGHAAQKILECLIQP